jgi:hypothetical protein
MGVMRTLGRVLFYSEIRAFESMRGAGGRISSAAAAVGERIRARRQAQAPAYAQELERLAPAEKFAFLYEKFEWSEVELRQQQAALRRSRRVLLVLSAVFAAAFVFVLIRAPWWLALIVISALGFACVKSLLSVFQLALYEAQIERRAIFEARDFLGLRDFWWRLLR